MKRSLHYLIGFLPLGAMAATTAWGDEKVIVTTEASRTEVREHEKSDNKNFCSKVSEDDAQQKCQLWLAQQQKTLGARVLTSFCSEGSISAEESCLYRAKGEIKYVLKSKKTGSATDTSK